MTHPSTTITIAVSSGTFTLFVLLFKFEVKPPTESLPQTHDLQGELFFSQIEKLASLAKPAHPDFLRN